MVKHIQTICQQQPTICLSMFDQFVQLALKGLKWFRNSTIFHLNNTHDCFNPEIYLSKLVSDL